MTSPVVGEQLSLSLTISHGKNVAGYEATVKFDPAALRYVDSAIGDYLPGTPFALPPVIGDDRVTLGAMTRDGQAGSKGTLATLRFEVLDVKASSVKLLNFSLVDQFGNRARPRLEDGLVVLPPPLGRDANGDVAIHEVAKVSAALGDGGAAPPDPFAALSTLYARYAASRRSKAARLDRADSALRRGGRFLYRALTVLTPKETTLLPNYPDPFSVETWIPYHLAQSSDVEITIYDTEGRSVRRLAIGRQAAGYYVDREKAAQWDGRGESGVAVGSGGYIYQLRAGDVTMTRRMEVVR